MQEPIVFVPHKQALAAQVDSSIISLCFYLRFKQSIPYQSCLRQVLWNHNDSQLLQIKGNECLFILTASV